RERPCCHCGGRSIDLVENPLRQFRGQQCLEINRHRAARALDDILLVEISAAQQVQYCEQSASAAIVTAPVPVRSGRVSRDKRGPAVAVARQRLWRNDWYRQATGAEPFEQIRPNVVDRHILWLVDDLDAACEAKDCNSPAAAMRIGKSNLDVGN